MYWKNGAYYRVQRNRWTRLSARYNDALRRYADLEAPSSLWPNLVALKYADYHRAFDRGELSKNTLSQYDSIRPRITAAFGDFDPHEITTAHVSQFMELYGDTPNIANRMLSVLRAIFDKGCRTGACDFNPAHGVKRWPEKKRSRLITEEEYGAIRDKANPHTRLIMDVCFLTAQRIGDVLAIKHEHIRPEGIFFMPQKAQGQKRILVAMTPELQQCITEAKALRKVMCAYLFHPKGSTKPYSYYTIRDSFERARKAAGVEQCTLHDLRAMALTAVDAAGGDAQSLAAHTSRATTLRYLRSRKTTIVQGPGLRQSIDTDSKTG
jgi:integrase